MNKETGWAAGKAGHSRVLALLSTAMCLSAFGQLSGETSLKLTVRLDYSGARDDSFAVKPKVIYRSGTRYCRVEELPNPATGVHGLMIVNEPDAWIVNLFTKKAQHIVDPGPTFRCRLPIFQEPEAARAGRRTQLSELEFGHEIEYFRARGAIPKEVRDTDGKPAMSFDIEVEGSTLALLTNPEMTRPLTLSRLRGSSRETFVFDSYEKVGFQERLFAKPTGVEITEVR